MPKTQEVVHENSVGTELSIAIAALDSLVLARIAQGEAYEAFLATPVAYRGHPNAFAGLRALDDIIDRRRAAIAQLEPTQDTEQL